MRHRGKLSAAIAATAAGLLVLPVNSARADTISSLTQLTSFHQMLVDEQAGYVFLSEGQDQYGVATNGTDDTPGIVVTDLSGQYVTTLDAGMGADGMALSADGATLYAALEPGNTVAVIDVSSITATTTVPTQAYWRLNGWEVPYSLAIQSGKLWVSYDPQQISDGQSSIGYFDLSQADPAFDDQLTKTMGYWSYAPNLAADPSGASGTLLASETVGNPPDFESYDVSGSAPAVMVPDEVLPIDASQNCGSQGNMAVVPGGGEFVVACGSPGTYYVSTKDFSVLGRYGDPAPDAVAVASGTGTVAAGADSILDDPGVYVYNPGETAPVNSYDFGHTGDNSTNQLLVYGGLALSPDGSELYAVTAPIYTNDYTLHVFDQPTLPKTSLRLTGPSTAAATGRITLNGTVTLATGPPPAQTAITVTRTGPDGTKTTLPSVATDASGAFTVTDAPPAAGTYTYTASDLTTTDNTVIASDSLTLTAAADTSALTLTAAPGKKGVTLSGTLTFGGSPAPAGETISFVRTTPDGSFFPYTLPTTATTTANGTFTMTDTPGQSETYTWTATYAGDTEHGAATASATAPITVKR